MKSDNNILIAFILNLSFSILEIFGGVFTGSVAIISDAVHDFGDAISTLVSYFLEKISKREPNDKYTYGYIRYSVLGAIFTNTVLMFGSILVIISAVKRLMNPVIINYDGMIILAILGVIINFMAVYFTRNGESLNQKAVNLHMLEDVLGWLIVLIGGIIIKFTGINMIDAFLSIIVSIFILMNVVRVSKKIVDLFLEKVPSNIDINDLKIKLLEISEIKDIHHIHIWSIDGVNNFLTMHVVVESKDLDKVKRLIKKELKENYGISHSTIEIESSNYHCDEVDCCLDSEGSSLHHHHH